MCQVELKGVTKQYAAAKPVFDNFSLTIAADTVSIILGKSGCGKSTLLNLIALLDKPTEGSVVLGGVDVSDFSVNEESRFRALNIGIILQGSALIPHLSVYDNLRLPLLYTNDHDSTNINRLLSALEIQHLVNKLPSQLSGGERQRVAIGRSIIHRPKLLLADEPTSALDSVTQNKIMNLLMKLKREYKFTLIIVTHDQSLPQYGDRVIEL